ncbi:hypothetical protein TTHERM_00394420 (macronuclear) [Tetrahymena thermophila SB210]|uniref:EF-hand domain-containing protein n=1 Tax=Tetrahymena thermophila (strain SB210) TaxID=312017 RepID=Q233B1_TETTS|nr:hypothetical protein TTHERM_00394420 [Tetrahymena thermophila SB210]EAR91669.2 hypothetical protein TTHERM_00394420 [Tetrahymena thermophila SB210]|eukprot:XP_001011914.2 hypothetical protein TTHERM_00394420 [Tetrahymena thermophila SB210]
MADKKIFREIEGIFGWIEEINKQQNKDDDSAQLDWKQQLTEFFKFIGVDDITEEEINALNELAMIKKEEQLKREKHQENKFRDYNEDNKLTYKDLMRVFIPDDDLTEKQIETDLEKEKKELMNAFRILTPNKSGDTIEISRLKKMIFLHEKEYTGQKQTKHGQNEKEEQKEKERAMQKIEDILSDLKIEGGGSDTFNFKEYLDDQFKIKKQ